ncbi:hypothetical protein BO99DRAFT_403977 [Aspergillus violaceofuscus CBS 115571]|uniref:Uncharacterized protein n=1 Tax=Aspergillus violaceofuscus (strain CBS 115571) TaxID=1450538 RepID=A0A2V5H2E6_ASPV1|nr:hypothetical protein BO99DRAFT_403977 [Aspergillus violaceofuscus CBS 115571]
MRIRAFLEGGRGRINAYVGVPILNSAQVLFLLGLIRSRKSVSDPIRTQRKKRAN